MASKSTGRTLQALRRQAKSTCECTRATNLRAASIRQFSASPSRPEVQYENDKAERPRWSYTPERMKAPYPIRIADPAKKWECNNDPALLDKFYIRFLGRGGDQMLTEEVKWLAITHKSFDQGRRGFNDRLAYMGMNLSRRGFRNKLRSDCRSTDSESSDKSGITTLANGDEDSIIT
jgi:large subunit ribosomal protein L15